MNEELLDALDWFASFDTETIAALPEHKFNEYALNRDNLCKSLRPKITAEHARQRTTKKRVAGRRQARKMKESMR